MRKKSCYGCHHRKPVEHFYRSRKSRDGFTRSCITCCRKYNRAYYWANVERLREKNRLALRRRRYWERIDRQAMDW